MPPDTTSTRPTPRAFISYSWDDDAHKEWVLKFATRLRGDGVGVTLNQWHLHPGDQLPAFMEGAIRDNDYILIVCTPVYAERSNNRVGGVGYEGDIMTAEVFTAKNERKFIPIFRSGPDWASAAPSWLAAKYRIDLRGQPYRHEQYSDLVNTLHGTRPAAPAVIPRRMAIPLPPPTSKPFTWEPIHILHVIVDEVTAPRNDGTRGSALYQIPLQLSRSPTRLWIDLFVKAWDHPPSYTTMHRPGIARIDGDKLILDGTHIEEVERVHQSTLVLALNIANSKMQEIEAEMWEREQAKCRQQEEHDRKLRETAARIRFE